MFVKYIYHLEVESKTFDDFTFTEVMDLLLLAFELELDEFFSYLIEEICSLWFDTDDNKNHFILVADLKPIAIRIKDIDKNPKEKKFLHIRRRLLTVARMLEDRVLFSLLDTIHDPYHNCTNFSLCSRCISLNQHKYWHK